MVDSNQKSSEFDWDKAIRLHNHRVTISVMALGLSIDQAEDLAHQAWMRLIEQEKRGAITEIKLPGLAIAQARYLALNDLKKRENDKNRSVPVDDLWSSSVLQDQHSEHDPESRLLAREQLERALQTLEECSESARAVFCHVYSDPAPNHTIVAQRVGISVQRVRQILCELRKKMRYAMESEQ